MSGTMKLKKTSSPDIPGAGYAGVSFPSAGDRLEVVDGDTGLSTALALQSTLDDAATAIPYGNGVTPTLPDAVAWAAGGYRNVLAYDATGDGTIDDAAAIQAADDAVTNGGVVLFPPGKYKIDSQINKSPYTLWLGSVPGRGTAGYGSVLYTESDIAMVMVEVSDGTSKFGKYAGFENLSFLKNAYNAAHTSSFGLRFLATSGSPRQQRVVNCDFRNFYYNIHVNGAGELYLSRVFSTVALYPFFANGLGDSMFHQCLFGSGIGVGPSGQSAMQIQQAGNLIFEAVRFQVQDGGDGIRMTSCRDVRFNDCIVDQNESFGMYLINCQNIEINGADIFDNGTTGTPRPGVRINGVGETFTADASTDVLTISGSYIPYTGQKAKVSSAGTLPAGLSANTEYFVIRASGTTLKLATTFANAQAGTAVDITDAGSGTHTLVGLCQDIRLNGGGIRDRNKGSASEVQDEGIQFAVSGGGQINRVTVGGTLMDVTTPLETANNVTSGLRVDLAGKPPVTAITTDAQHNITPSDADVFYWTGIPTANRALRLEAPANRTKDRVTLIRNASATPSIKLNRSDATTLASLLDGDSATVVFDGATGDYVLESLIGQRIVNNETTSTATSSTGEDDLKSAVIPAALLGSNGSLRLWAAGVKAGSAGNKTIKLYLGVTSITVHAAANNTDDWILEADIINVTASSQKVIWKLLNPTGVVAAGYDTMAEDTTTAKTVKITGECADGADTITATRWRVQLLQ